MTPLAVIASTILLAGCQYGGQVERIVTDNEFRMREFQRECRAARGSSMRLKRVEGGWAMECHGSSSE